MTLGSTDLHTPVNPDGIEEELATERAVARTRRRYRAPAMRAVDDGANDEVRRVLRVLADLSPSADAKGSSLVISTEWFHWLPLSAVRLFQRSDTGDVTAVPVPVAIDAGLAERLAAVDQIRPRNGASASAGSGSPAERPTRKGGTGGSSVRW